MKDEHEDFQHIYTQFYPKIVGYIRGITGDADAEDAAQEVFVKVSRSLADFRGESSLSTWIFRIATNTAIDQVRKATRAPLVSGGKLTEDDDAVQEDALPPDAVLIRKDMNACIRGLVNNLPQNYRTILVLCDLEGFTNAEAADILGVTPDTAKIRLHRARRALKRSMDGACTFYRNEHNELACDRKPATHASGISQFPVPPSGD